MVAFNPPTTCPRLLGLLGSPGMDEAWATFLRRYGPLIDARCRAAGLQAADADDVRAVVCAQLLRAIRGFRHDPSRRFRGYLQKVVDNAIRSHWRTLRRRPGWVGRGGESDDAPPEPLARLGAEIDDRVQDRIDDVLRLLDRIRSQVGTEAWTAFRLTAVEGLSAKDAGDRLGKTPTAVYAARSRVLTRLRAEARALDD